mmetsp:Transcript_57157/g.66817  ORF Transcript_57157/g.66817 Transcript_57157/m.66817 type:complete len:690 (-) Transcript_57157:463-2532(-)
MSQSNGSHSFRSNEIRENGRWMPTFIASNSEADCLDNPTSQDCFRASYLGRTSSSRKDFSPSSFGKNRLSSVDTYQNPGIVRSTESSISTENSSFSVNKDKNNDISHFVQRSELFAMDQRGDFASFSACSPPVNNVSPIQHGTIPTNYSTSTHYNHCRIPLLCSPKHFNNGTHFVADITNQHMNRGNNAKRKIAMITPTSMPFKQDDVEDAASCNEGRRSRRYGSFLPKPDDIAKDIFDGRLNQIITRPTSPRDTSVVSWEHGSHAHQSEASNDVADDHRQYQNLPFPDIVHCMVTKTAQLEPCLINWIADGKAFKILNSKSKELSVVLQKYFRHGKYTSLQRQLNMYGWRKCVKGPYKGGFHHENFHRDPTYPSFNLALVKRRAPPECRSRKSASERDGGKRKTRTTEVDPSNDFKDDGNKKANKLQQPVRPSKCDLFSPVKTTPSIDRNHSSPQNPNISHYCSTKPNLHSGADLSPSGVWSPLIKGSGNIMTRNVVSQSVVHRPSIADGRYSSKYIQSSRHPSESEKEIYTNTHFDSSVLFKCRDSHEFKRKKRNKCLSPTRSLLKNARDDVELSCFENLDSVNFEHQGYRKSNNFTVESREKRQSEYMKNGFSHYCKSEKHSGSKSSEEYGASPFENDGYSSAFEPYQSLEGPMLEPSQDDLLNCLILDTRISSPPENYKNVFSND